MILSIASKNDGPAIPCDGIAASLKQFHRPPLARSHARLVIQPLRTNAALTSLGSVSFPDGAIWLGG
jgi:hypothetical protein